MVEQTSSPPAQIPLVRCNFCKVYGLKKCHQDPCKPNGSSHFFLSIAWVTQLLSPKTEMQFSRRTQTENGLFRSLKENKPKTCSVEPYILVCIYWIILAGTESCVLWRKLLSSVAQSSSAVRGRCLSPFVAIEIAILDLQSLLQPWRMKTDACCGCG